MLNLRPPSALGTQPIQLLQKGINMLQQSRAGLCKVLLVDLPLLLRISIHMGIVELLLHIPVAGQLLVESANIMEEWNSRSFVRYMNNAIYQSKRK